MENRPQFIMCSEYKDGYYWANLTENVKRLRISFGEMTHLHARRMLTPYWKAFKTPKRVIKEPIVQVPQQTTCSKTYNRTFELSVIGGSYKGNLKENIRRIREIYNKKMCYREAISILSVRWKAYKRPKKSPVEHRSWCLNNIQTELTHHLIPPMVDIILSYSPQHNQYFQGCLNDIRNMLCHLLPYGRGRRWKILEYTRDVRPKLLISTLRSRTDRFVGN